MSNYESRHPDDMVPHPLSEIREWDEALALLGIQDSTQTPAEAIRELNNEIGRLQAAANLSQYWEKQYNLVRAQIERVRSALDAPVSRRELP